jgi:hypothetical protein
VFTEVISYIAAVLTILTVVGLVALATRGDPERRAEDAARAFFDEHGRWPDD